MASSLRVSIAILHCASETVNPVPLSNPKHSWLYLDYTASGSLWDLKGGKKKPTLCFFFLFHTKMWANLPASVRGLQAWGSLTFARAFE